MIVLTRQSSAVWEGDLKHGRGKAKAGSGAFEVTLSYATRFEREFGTNPEELIGAAHAGCFSMALAGGIAGKGYLPKRIKTTAEVSLEKTEKGFRIQKIILSTQAEIPDISEDEFQREAKTAKANCPVSQALAGVDIGLEAKLVK